MDPAPPSNTYIANDGRVIDRPPFHAHITSCDDYGPGVKALGFWFHDPVTDAESERYALLTGKGMSVLAMADALEKIVIQMRTRTGSNGCARLEGHAVNQTDFPAPISRPDY